MATYKNLTARGVWGDQQPLIFILGPLHISKTNRARKSKFSTVVDTGTNGRALYKNLSAKWRLARSAMISSIFYVCDVIVVEICLYKVKNLQLWSKNLKWNWVYLCSQPS